MNAIFLYDFFPDYKMKLHRVKASRIWHVTYFPNKIIYGSLSTLFPYMQTLTESMGKTTEDIEILLIVS